MWRRISSETEYFELIERGKGTDVIKHSWPKGQERKSWILLVGDCSFDNISKEFQNDEVNVSDRPQIITVMAGKVEDVMDYVTSKLARSIKLIVIHLGASNLASKDFDPIRAAATLLRKCSLLLETHKTLEEVSICLLSPREVDKQGRYGEKYIKAFNERVSKFNQHIEEAVKANGEFSLINFGLPQENLGSVLRKTGLNGVNSLGRKLLGESLRSLIKFKVNTSRSNYDKFHQLFPPAEEMINRLVVLRCDKEGHDVSHYTMARNSVRLSLVSQPYPESESPRLAPDNGGSISKKRRSCRKSAQTSIPDKKSRMD